MHTLHDFPILHLAITIIIIYVGTWFWLMHLNYPPRQRHILSCTVSVLVALIGAVLGLAWFRLTNH